MSERSRWTPLHAHLHQTVKDRRLLEPGQRIVVAVSGGQDSICLAKLLLDLQSKWRWDLAIAHCNHRWRLDSAENAAFVQAIAARWQLTYFQRTADRIPPNEAAARDWRYQSLGEIAQDHGYTHIVTGHTASDRAETLLYNLIRGSGSDGLQAMAWRRSLTPTIELIRPLLGVSRAQTADLCQTLGLAIWEDTTNQNLHIARNRIRLELLPYLREHFNPQTEGVLAQTAEVLQAEVAYLDAQASALCQQAMASEKGATGLSCSVLKGTAIALQRRVVRQFLQQMLGTTPDFEHIEKLRALIFAPNRTQTDPFPGGMIAYVEGDWIRLKPS